MRLEPELRSSLLSGMAMSAGPALNDASCLAAASAPPNKCTDADCKFPLYFFLFHWSFSPKLKKNHRRCCTGWDRLPATNCGTWRAMWEGQIRRLSGQVSSASHPRSVMHAFQLSTFITYVMIYVWHEAFTMEHASNIATSASPHVSAGLRDRMEEMVCLRLSQPALSVVPQCVLRIAAMLEEEPIPASTQSVADHALLLLEVLITQA